MIKIIHTSDWHLGQKINNLDRTEEHTAFLSWLLELLNYIKPHGLLICGDIFDSTNPPIDSLKHFIQFVVDARNVCRNIFIIAGNHDSSYRLDALRPILKEIGVAAIGKIPDNKKECLFPVYDSSDSVMAFVGAVPYLRPMDLPPPSVGETIEETIKRIISSIGNVYSEVSSLHDKSKPLILTGHLFVQGGEATSESERPVQIEAGKIISVPTDVFPLDAAYVALGHLHRGQFIAGNVPVYYSGSIIPMSFSEASYKHHVLEVNLNDCGKVFEVNPHYIPRRLQMYDIKGSLDEITETLESLKSEYPVNSKERALVRLNVSLKEPDPSLRDKLTEIIDDSNITLMSLRRIGFDFEGAAYEAHHKLDELTPLDVFKSKYLQEYGDNPSELLKGTFLELLAEVEG
ncbi:MAG: exonuclease SbcCD subunit D C-terminal domain-containing protein [Desulfobacterales bacterium]|nr:exonuclease SbcCD subunit D C-terminal domain-containing protein [Desulfobacterales bacterium]